jgi:hypothetical protein
VIDDSAVEDGGIDRCEAAMRRLPEAHSLALRLTRAGVADEVVCEYLHIEPEGLDTLIRVAEEKLAAELENQRPARRLIADLFVVIRHEGKG